MRAVLCLTLLMLLMHPSWAAKQVAWDDLIDAEAAEFDDPFAALNIFELRSLGTVIRLRKQLTAQGIDDEKRRRMKERLDREEAKLAVSGVKTDWLLSQRKRIARKRAAASLAGNQDLDGQNIVIPGYVIPVLDAGSETSATGYLVPERGMCSHMPAPDPNQMIRYKLATDWQADSIYEPVQLKGTLSIRPTRQEITLLDGQIEMIAVFDMTVTEVVPLAGKGPQPDARSFLNFLHPDTRAE